MKRTTTQTEAKNEAYIALLNKDGMVVAFINPVKNVNPETLVESIKAKGLNVEIKTPNTEEVNTEL